MVTPSIHYPQIFFLLHGVSAVIIFMLFRFFKVKNSLMALLIALTFTLILILLILSNYFPQSIAFKSLTSFFGGFNPDPGRNYQVDDPLANLISIIAFVLSILVSIYSGEYLSKDHRQQYFYPLLLMMMCGFTGMLFASNLMVFYLFTELMSICTYSLVAFRRHTDTAIEAGFKYLIMGSVASIVFLAGTTFLFWSQGTINIAQIDVSNDWMSQAAVILLFSGLSLKSALVPLHAWLPDAHGRAPSSISAILSGIMVQGILFTMVKLILSMGFDQYLLGTILMILSILNILVGNLLGLLQTHTKRLLGYSTISQVGYMALCLALGLRNNLPAAIQTSFFFMIAHGISKSLAFLAKGVLHYHLGVTRIEDLTRATDLPHVISITFGLAILNLSAIPPFAGFTGKWMALSSLITSNDTLSVPAIIVFLTGSIIALGYYFPLLIKVFSGYTKRDNIQEAGKKKISLWMGLPLAILAISILYISAAPQSVIQITEEASLFLLRAAR